MTNAELIAELRGHILSVPLTLLHDAAAALEAAEKRIAELEKQEPTEKQVVDYCHKRCLVIVEEELFHRMKSTFSQLPKEGEWIEDDTTYCGADRANYKCSLCGKIGGTWKRGLTQDELPNYCPNCGARMRGERYDH